METLIFLDPAALADFRTRLAGDVILPTDPAYDEARAVWNGMIDRRPALIVRCTRTEDVQECLRFATAHEWSFTVRGGGHNVAGSAVCDDGLVIDLSRMRGVTVDPQARQVTAQGGATIGDVDRATVPFGLATPLGVVTETGIAGLTLGGGMGWMRRKHGLSCDALRAVEIVTAAGEVVTASAASHPELFWGVRGGGGNFGVVTRFTYELYEVAPEVFFLTIFYPIAQAREVLRAMQAFMATAPEAFAPLGVLAHVPPFDVLPAERHGEECLVLVGPYIGDPEEGARVLAPLRTLAPCIADLSSPTPYLDVQQFFDADYPGGHRYYWKSANLTEVTDAVFDELIALNAEAPSLHSTLDLWFQGGAMSRVAADATAFGSRQAPMGIGIEANWHDPADDEANIAWAQRCYQALQPFSDGSLYLNFPGVGPDAARQHQLRATYGANYERLALLKHEYDPENRFRTHQNIPPLSVDQYV